MRFVVKASLYIGCFFLTYFPATLNRVIMLIRNDPNASVLVSQATLMPLGAFFNALIYFGSRLFMAPASDSMSTDSKTSDVSYMRFLPGTSKTHF
jgi:hypothetical protein